MNREIKFRGMKIDSSGWVYGYYAKIPPRSKTQQIILNKPNLNVIIDTNGVYSEIIPESKGQYTDLKDKNGKEIYEGDKIKVKNCHKDWINREFEVKFQDGCFGIIHKQDYDILSFGKYKQDAIDQGLRWKHFGELFEVVRKA